MGGRNGAQELKRSLKDCFDGRATAATAVVKEPGRFSVRPGDDLSLLPGDQGKQAEWYCFPVQTAESCKVKLPRRLIFILQK